MKKPIIAAMLIVLTLTGCEEPKNYDDELALQKCINHYFFYHKYLNDYGGEWRERKSIKADQKRQYDSWTGKQKCCWDTAARTLWRQLSRRTEPVKKCDENNPPEFTSAASIEVNKAYVEMLNLFK